MVAKCLRNIFCPNRGLSRDARISTGGSTLAAHYVQFASQLPLLAMPLSAQAEIKEGKDAVALFGNSGEKMRRLFGEISRDLLMAIRAERLLVLFREDDGLLFFDILKDGLDRDGCEKTKYHKKKLVIKSDEFGIGQREAKRLARGLSRSHAPRAVGADYLRLNKLRDEAADRLGLVVPWTVSSFFSEPFTLLVECDQKILAIRICKYLEREINELFFESGLDASIEIPCYSLDELMTAKKNFVDGRIGIAEYSKIVFRMDR